MQCQRTYLHMWIKCNLFSTNEKTHTCVRNVSSTEGPEIFQEDGGLLPILGGRSSKKMRR
jgi:hypothetical protein